MIRTGTQYLDSIRDSREVFVSGERVREPGDSAVIHWFREHPGAAA
jgi:aromatic ring hydroxylase